MIESGKFVFNNDAKNRFFSKGPQIKAINLALRVLLWVIKTNCLSAGRGKARIRQPIREQQPWGFSADQLTDVSLITY